MEFCENLIFFELDSPMPHVFKMAASQDPCSNLPLPKRKLFVCDTDEESTDVSVGTSDEYIPNELEDTDSSDGILEVR